MKSSLSFVVLAVFFGVFAGCATKQKPTQLLVLASAAMKGAESAQAERRAPDLYRRAENSFWAAKKAYAEKDYELAAKQALLARRYAERAEIRAAVSEAIGSE